MFGWRLFRRAKPAGLPRVDLALQGGGSHGAFTWGVLDRLLESGAVDFGGVSGTSAGAVNAALLASGWARGGRDGARESLAGFWGEVGRAGERFAAFSPQRVRQQAAALQVDGLPAYRWFSSFFRAFSPYELNPLDLNPLRDLLREHVDEAALKRSPFPLFITATRVATGQPRVFTGDELSIDALLASACLPLLFRAVEIDGEAYWDGGYSGNPALFPLIYRTSAADILLVKINPRQRPGTPVRGDEIVDRVGEISFNASLVGEMRAIAFVNRLLRERRLDRRRYRALRLHMIADDEGLAAYGPASKTDTDRAFLDALHALGRAAAERFLERDLDGVGRRSTLDIEREFLGAGA